MIDLNGYPFDTKSLVHLISLHGEDLIGVDLGIANAQSFVQLLQACPNIKTLHGVDIWDSYIDDVLPDSPTTDIIEAEWRETQARFFVKHSGVSDRAVLHKRKSEEFLNDIEDESLDFVFIDTWVPRARVYGEINDWYKKVKKGGIFSGHDYSLNDIRQSLHAFREANNITQSMSVFDDVWVWYK